MDYLRACFFSSFSFSPPPSSHTKYNPGCKFSPPLYLARCRKKEMVGESLPLHIDPNVRYVHPIMVI